jgi:hypothetical protein
MADARAAATADALLRGALADPECFSELVVLTPLAVLRPASLGNISSSSQQWTEGLAVLYEQPCVQGGVVCADGSRRGLRRGCGGAHVCRLQTQLQHAGSLTEAQPSSLAHGQRPHVYHVGRRWRASEQRTPDMAAVVAAATAAAAACWRAGARQQWQARARMAAQGQQPHLLVCRPALQGAAVAAVASCVGRCGPRRLQPRAGCTAAPGSRCSRTKQQQRQAGRTSCGTRRHQGAGRRSSERWHQGSSGSSSSGRTKGAAQQGCRNTGWQQECSRHPCTAAGSSGCGRHC